MRATDATGRSRIRLPRETDRWLACLLMGRRAVDSEAVRRAAVAHGFNWRTIQRAADRLGVSRRRVGFGPGSRVQWDFGDRLGDGVRRLAAAEGVEVRIADGVLRASGPKDALERWAPTLRQLNVELRRSLDGTTV